MKKQMKGLTLMELLIVVAIIVALAGLLFPVFQSVRERAYISVCTSNQKQIYYALQMYEEDYGEFLYIPTGVHPYTRADKKTWRRVHIPFYNAMSQYTKDRSVFICPKEPDPEERKKLGMGSYGYYYPFARWRGFPITPNLVCLFCIFHAKGHVVRTKTESGEDLIIIYFAPYLVCLMDGSVRLHHNPHCRFKDVPFTYPCP